MTTTEDIFDILVIGAGINGAGLARDAAGRGLRVALIEADDIGGKTSAASTKLIHGGLRYLESGQFRLVRKALAEREVLLDIAPHITRPLAFVLPHEPHLRPAWMIRAGLFLYDRLAKRKQVPGSRMIDLRRDVGGRSLNPSHTRGFRYWDGWVDDSRLVVLNAIDAQARGATIRPRARVTRAVRDNDLWRASLDNGEALAARFIVNAAGPWAGIVAREVMQLADTPSLRLVQGTHIVTRRVNMGPDAYMLQQPDGRVVFAIPYERDFSLIGTTELPIDDPDAAEVRPEEVRYLLDAVNRYASRPVGPNDIVHSFVGVRPLVTEPGKDAHETSRDWRFVAHDGGGALTIVGGKITTYRLLAEAALKIIAPTTTAWTASAPLPGGDVPRAPGETGQAAFARWLRGLIATNEHYDPLLIERLARLYGTRTEEMLKHGLGENFGGMFEVELEYLAREEWARSAEDALWRRTKLGLHLDNPAKMRVVAWFRQRFTAC